MDKDVHIMPFFKNNKICWVVKTEKELNEEKIEQENRPEKLWPLVS